ncbi:MAG: 4-hydroxy-tetrahydrodipicolinate synthase [Clostridia bacterium]|nr:4-hydroxy-tetrahydrodipicolinate synthase [Clostridia bacterium]
MRTKSIFTGSCCAIVTPFDKNGNTNFEELKKIVEFQIENKTDCICACGTTGEASTLNDKEHLEVIEFIVDTVNGRIPVIAGTGSNDTRHGIELCKNACSLGVDGLLIVTPYYNKTSQRGLIHNYSVMAECVDKPIILYNVPGRTGCNISPATLNTLADHPNIVGIKEASGDMSQFIEMMALCGDRLDFYSGNDDINVPIISMGGKGAISVLANVAPRQAHDMVQFALDGDFKQAAKMQCEALDLINSLFCEVNPIPVKEGMNILGFNAGPTRLPLYEMAPENVERLKNSMKNYGLIK